VAVAQLDSDNSVMLCTSGFVDDVTFSHNGTSGSESTMTLCFVAFARWRHQSDIRRYVWLVSQMAAPGAKVLTVIPGLFILLHFSLACTFDIIL